MPIVDLCQFPLKYSAQDFWIHGADGTSGPGLDGREQVLYTENRHWIGQISFPNTANQVARYLISVGDRARGRAHVLRLPFHNVWDDPWAENQGDYLALLGFSATEIEQGSSSFWDGSRFSDASGFALPSNSEPVVAQDAPVGASQIFLDGYRGRNLPIASLFSFNDFLYRVEDNNDGEIRFNPPLREPVTAGSVTSINTPTARVRLQSGSVWQPKVRPGRTVEPFSVKLIEAFER